MHDDERAGPETASVRSVGAKLLTVRQVAQVLALGRTTIYQLIATGELETIHVGRSCRIAADTLDDFVSRRRNGRATVQPSRSAARAERQLDPGKPTT